MADTSFNIASGELQVAQITQLNQFFYTFELNGKRLHISKF